MRFINLCEHPFITPTGTHDPSGTMARVVNTYDAIGQLDGVPVSKVLFEGVVGLPDPQPGTIFLVSRAVFALVPDRMDVLAPSGQIKDLQNKVIGNRQWLAHGPVFGMDRLTLKVREEMEEYNRFTRQRRVASR